MSSPSQNEEERKALLAESDGHGDDKKTLHDLVPEHKSKWDSVVPTESFEVYPQALCFARTVKVLLVLIVVGSIVGALMQYFSGIVLIQREVYFYTDIEVPTVAICPDYGSADFKDFEPLSAKKELLPRSLNTTVVDLKSYPCVAYAHCHCIDFPEAQFFHHDSGIEFLALRFKVDGPAKSFLFGFNEPGRDDYHEIPHTFNYGMLHQKTMGHLSLHQVERKMDRFKEGGGGKILHYDFETAGMSVPSENGETVILFGFKTFFVPLDRAVASIWSPFALIALGAYLVVLINNLNVFELLFPVIQHPVFVQREPASFLRTMCPCSGCVKRKAGVSDASRLDKIVVDHHERKKKKKDKKRHEEEESARQEP